MYQLSVSSQAFTDPLLQNLNYPPDILHLSYTENIAIKLTLMLKLYD